MNIKNFKRLEDEHHVVSCDPLLFITLTLLIKAYFICQSHNPIQYASNSQRPLCLDLSQILPLPYQPQNQAVENLFLI